jgi:hypothetical protein
MARLPSTSRVAFLLSRRSYPAAGSTHDAAEKRIYEDRNLMRRFSARMDIVWLGLGLLGIGLCVAVLATALAGTTGTVLSALGLPAMLAGVMLLDSARHRR